MFTFILSLLSGPFGSIIKWGLGIISSLLIGWGVLTWYNNHITSQALASYNQKQLEQVIQDQKKFQDQLNQVQSAQKQITDQLDKNLNDLNNHYDLINKWLNSPVVSKQDKEASKLLTDTLKQLQGTN